MINHRPRSMAPPVVRSAIGCETIGSSWTSVQTRSAKMSTSSWLGPTKCGAWGGPSIRSSSTSRGAVPSGAAKKSCAVVAGYGASTSQNIIEPSGAMPATLTSDVASFVQAASPAPGPFTSMSASGPVGCDCCTVGSSAVDWSNATSFAWSSLSTPVAVDANVDRQVRSRSRASSQISRSPGPLRELSAQRGQTGRTARATVAPVVELRYVRFAALAAAVKIATSEAGPDASGPANSVWLPSAMVRQYMKWSPTAKGLSGGYRSRVAESRTPAGAAPSAQAPPANTGGTSSVI